MSRPVRHLPVLQKWDCQVCGNCCHQYQVAVTEEERQRILAQDWSELGMTPLFKRLGWFSRRYRLNHRKDGACVFLGDNNRCLIHARYGAEAKPLACRLYPFVLVPVGDEWHVGMRYACPSATANKGRAVGEHAADLGRFGLLLERQENLEGEALPPARLRRGQSVPWPDVGSFVRAVLDLVGDRGDRLERRWRKCLHLARLCRQARFDKVSGQRLTDFLQVLTAGIDAEVPQTVTGHPSWVGRSLFLQLLAVYTRRDHGPDKGAATQTWLGRLLATARFAFGAGRVPKVNRHVRPVSFAAVESAEGKLGSAAQELLERYYRVKVESLQFCGPANYGVSFWDGLEMLALTLPAIAWLSRAVEADSQEEAVEKAVCVVDDHFGFNRVLVSTRYRMVHRILGSQGEVEKLLGWYGK
jgi:lysine-N-methylase